MTHDHHSTDDSAARITAAYAHYNARYNNETYLAVQTTLVREVCGAYQAQEPALLERALHHPELHTIMGLVIDAALELCGHPDHRGTSEALLRLLVRQPVTEDTLHAIVRHWDNFADADNAFGADFLAAGRAALLVHALIDRLHRAISLTSDAPGAAGNAAHHWLSGAYRLLRGAELVLTGEPSAAYIAEQVNAGQRHLMEGQAFLADLSAPPASAQAPTIQPYRTLLLSEDSTYPGLVTRADKVGVSVTWYKWGFRSEAFVTWMPLAQVAECVLSSDACRTQFGGLPPEYQR